MPKFQIRSVQNLQGSDTSFPSPPSTLGKRLSLPVLVTFAPHIPTAAPAPSSSAASHKGQYLPWVRHRSAAPLPWAIARLRADPAHSSCAPSPVCPAPGHYNSISALTVVDLCRQDLLTSVSRARSSNYVQEEWWHTLPVSPDLYSSFFAQNLSPGILHNPNSKKKLVMKENKKSSNRRAGLLLTPHTFRQPQGTELPAALLPANAELTLARDRTARQGDAGSTSLQLATHE